MNKRLKELAEQAGLQPYYEKEFIRFAELVRQDEREACAKLCEIYSMAGNIAGLCATAIRARNNT